MEHPRPQIQSPYCSVFIIENIYRQYMIGDRRTGLNIGWVESASGNTTTANKTRKIKPAYLKSKKKKANEKCLIKARQTILLNAPCLREVPTSLSIRRFWRKRGKMEAKKGESWSRETPDTDAFTGAFHPDTAWFDTIQSKSLLVIGLSDSRVKKLA